MEDYKRIARQEAVATHRQVALVPNPMDQIARAVLTGTRQKFMAVARALQLDPAELFANAIGKFAARQHKGVVTVNSQDASIFNPTDRIARAILIGTRQNFMAVARAMKLEPAELFANVVDRYAGRGRSSSTPSGCDTDQTL